MEEFGDQVLVEKGGKYELVETRNLLTPDNIENENRVTTSTTELQNENETEPVPRTMTSPVPARVTSPAPAQVTSPAPARVTSPAPARVTSPAPARVTSPVPEQVTSPAPARVTSPAPERVTSPAPARVTLRPTSSQSLKSSSQPLLYSKHYKHYERTSTPNRNTKRPMSATPISSRPASQHHIDQAAIERRGMADAAFEHWRKQKDKETIKKKRQQKKKENEPPVPRTTNNDSFNAWLQNKTKQKAEERHVEKLRANIITSELLSVDYSESDLAYERWLKKKNQIKKLENRQKLRKKEEDRAEMRTVIHNIKTRWKIEYNKSNYLHPNAVWDKSPIYANEPPLFPW